MQSLLNLIRRLTSTPRRRRRTHGARPAFVEHLETRQLMSATGYENQAELVTSQNAAQETTEPTSERPQVCWIGSTSESRPDLCWSVQKIERVEEFELQVTHRATSERVIHETGLTDTTYRPNTDLVDGEYRYWVRAKSGGEWGTWSVNQDFQVATSHHLPGQPVISRPERVRYGQIEVTWTDQTSSSKNGVDRYELWVNDISANTPRVIHRTNLTESHFTLKDQLPFGRYRVWVRAGNEYGWSEWSAGRNVTHGELTRKLSFELRRPPYSPMQITWSGRDTRFTESYELWINNAETGQLVLHETALQAAEFDTSGLPAGRYRAWVRSHNRAGVGPWSEAIDLEIAAPCCTFPFWNYNSVAGNDGSVRLSWDAVPHANQYEVWVTNRDSGKTVFHRSNYSSTELLLTDLNGGDYAFTFRGVNAAGATAWVWPEHFHIVKGPVPAATRLTNPAQLIGDLPQFAWDEVDTADSYELWVADIATGETVLRERGIQSTQFAPESIDLDGRYRVWVRGISETAGAGEWSHPQEVLVSVRGLPDQIVIDELNVTENGYLRVSWLENDRADVYEIWIQTADRGNVLAHASDIQNTFFELQLSDSGSGIRLWVRGINSTGGGEWSAAVDYATIQSSTR